MRFSGEGVPVHPSRPVDAAGDLMTVRDGSGGHPADAVWDIADAAREGRDGADALAIGSPQRGRRGLYAL
jgi:hypothetical protein